MFRSLMDSPTVSLFNPQKSVEYQDMTQPLSHYYMVKQLTVMLCMYLHMYVCMHMM